MAFISSGLTPLQMLQKKYWQDLGSCERVRMNLEAMPDEPFKQEALEYVARVKRIIKDTYVTESIQLKAEARAKAND